MPLFYVQDPDRPAWVLAADYTEAVLFYRMAVGVENDLATEEVELPSGVHLVCDDSDVILDETGFHG